MKCESIMLNDVLHIDPQTPVEDIAILMRHHGISALVVCDFDLQVLGVVTASDIVLRAVATRRLAQATAADIMTRDVLTCSPATEVVLVRQRMQAAHISRLVCVDEEGRLAGMVTLNEARAALRSGVARHETDKFLGMMGSKSARQSLTD